MAAIASKGGYGAKLMATLDGIVNLNKPSGISSAKALYRVRSLTQQRKSGHAGTLDPGATGVLVLCLGRATKLVEAIMDQPKVYRTAARLDVTSESHDSDRPLIPFDVATPPARSMIEAALASFEGSIQQVPPQISAIKVNGVPAYKRTRHEPPTVLRPRSVTVYWLHIHRYQWPELDLEICCGRGMYVRSLIRDLGQRLGTGGCLTALVRSRVGPFELEHAWSFQQLEDIVPSPAQPDRARSPVVNASEPPYLISLDRARESLDPSALTIPSRP